MSIRNNNAAPIEPEQDAPSDEFVRTIGLWADFEQIPKLGRIELFPALVHALHYSSSSGLSLEQLQDRASTLAEVQHDIALQIERISHPVTPRDDYDY